MADVKCEVVNFAIDSSITATNTQTISLSSGFGTPKGAIFFATAACTTDDTPVADASMSIGFTDGTNECVFGVIAADAQASTTDTHRWHRADGVIYAADQSGTIQHHLSISSFGTDQVVLTVDNQAGGDYLVTMVVFTGADLQACGVGTHDDLDNVTPQNISTGTSTSQEPDIVFLTCIGLNTAMPADNVHSILTFGAWHNDGSDTQRVAGVGNQSGISTSAVGAYVGNTEAVGQPFQTSWAWGGTISSTANDQFTVTQSANAGNDIIGFLSLTFASGSKPSISLGDMSWPTSGNYAETGPGFTPQLGIVTAASGPTARNTYTATNTSSFSIMSFDDTTIGTISLCQEDAVGNSNETTEHNNSPKIIDDDGTTTLVDGTFDGFDSSGWDFTLSTNPGTAVLGWYLAIAGGSGATGPAVFKSIGGGGLLGDGNFKMIG